jgi:hypothetical protein
MPYRYGYRRAGRVVEFVIGGVIILCLIAFIAIAIIGGG